MGDLTGYGLRDRSGWMDGWMDGKGAGCMMTRLGGQEEVCVVGQRQRGRALRAGLVHGMEIKQACSHRLEIAFLVPVLQLLISSVSHISVLIYLWVFPLGNSTLRLLGLIQSKCIPPSTNLADIGKTNVAADIVWNFSAVIRHSITAIASVMASAMAFLYDAVDNRSGLTRLNTPTQSI